MKTSAALFVLLFSISMLSVQSQIQKEKISFESANPFAFSDVILDLENQEKQEVYGQLTLPVDSLNPTTKYPLIIGVAGSLGWKKHHFD